MDDSALTHQLKQGNQLAFTILYDTYSEQVYRLAFKYLCNKELAEDAVQNLFMKVWIKRPSLDESRPLDLVRHAIEQLSPQRRKIFSLKISGKYSNQEIADKLNLSVNTIKFQYSQSLKQIKEIVRKCAISLLM